MTGAAFKAWRVAHGWSQRQVAAAVYYTPQSVAQWERGCWAVPPAVVAWAATLPAPRVVASYWPSAAGLRRYLAERHLTLRELADYCGVAETATIRWADGKRPLPPAVRAWLRAGAPARWDWAPPGLGDNVVAVQGKRFGVRAAVRPPAQVRHRGSTLLRRYARQQEATAHAS